jgi:hypothetical protein
VVAGFAMATGDFDFDGIKKLVVSALNEAFRTFPAIGMAYHWKGNGAGNFAPSHWSYKDM